MNVEDINKELFIELNNNDCYKHGWFYSKFANEELNDYFYDYQKNNFYYFPILIQIILIFIMLFNALMYSTKAIMIIVILITILETFIFMVIMFNPNFDKKFGLSIWKYYLTLFNSTVVLMSITLNLNESNFNIFTFNLLAILGVAYISLNFILKKFSIFTSLLTILIFFSLMFINIFTRTKIRLVNLDNLSFIRTDLSCNSMKKYEFDSNHKNYFEEKVENALAFHVFKIISFRNSTFIKFNSTENMILNNYLQKFREINDSLLFYQYYSNLNKTIPIYDNIFNETEVFDEFVYLYGLRMIKNFNITNDVEFQNSFYIKFDDFIKNFENKSFKDSYTYSILPVIKRKIIKLGINDSFNECIANIFQNNDNMRNSYYVLLNTGKYLISPLLNTANSHLNLISIGLFIILFFMLNYQIHSSQKENFLSREKHRKMKEYYEKFIKDLKSMVVSFNMKKLLFINNSFLDFIVIFSNSKIKNEINENNENNDNNKCHNDRLKYEMKSNNDCYNIIKELFSLIKNNSSLKESNTYANGINLLENIDKLLDEEITENFKLLGEFYIDFNSQRKYLTIFYRVFDINNSKFIDLKFDDITETINAKIETASNIAKEKVMAKVAHEFKTPLLIIKQNLSELNLKINTDEKENLIENIINISDYVSFLINDIINETNKTTLKISKNVFYLKDVLLFCQNIAKSLIKSFSNSNVKILLEIDPEIKYVKMMSDPIRLKQVFLNIISNSIKFTKSGSITICANIIRKEKENCDIMVKLIDTGTGIRPDDLAVLRKTLYNTNENPLVFNDNNKDNSMGTGLGIGIIQLILKKLEYDFDIDSIFGKGSTISIKLYNCFLIDESFEHNIQKNRKLSSEKFTLDCLIKENMANTSDIENINNYDLNETVKINEDNFFSNFNEEKLKIYEIKERIPSNNKIQINNDNLVINSGEIINKSVILVVDDNFHIRKSIINLLKSEILLTNYNIIEVNDGSQIIQKVYEDQYNGNLIKLIITDEEMEIMNGSVAISILKKLETEYKIKQIKYISITAHEISHHNILYDIGFDKVLIKPLKKEDIIQIITLLNAV